MTEKFDSTVVILAGGKSQRMGSDKALLMNSVKRLQKLSEKVGVKRCIVLCGDKSRRSLFEGEIWEDPAQIDSISDLILWLRDKLSGRVQLLPCDCYLLEKDGLEFLLEMENGVPMDVNGKRQPLMANFNQKSALFESKTLNELFSNLATYSNSQLSRQFANINTQDELKEILSEEQNS